MTTAAWALLAVAGLVGLADWVAVGLRLRPLEYVCTPLTIALLIGVAATLHPVEGLRRAYFVTALGLSLLGDVCRLQPGARDHEPAAPRMRPARLSAPPRPGLDWFLIGLGCFLVAQLDYVAGLRAGGPGLERVGLALLVVAPVAIPLGTIVARSLAGERLRPLRGPVVASTAVLSAMVASAVATGSLLVTLGAWLFLASDATLAVDRFVRRFRLAPVVVVVTYHLAQGLLTTSLVRS